MTELHQAIIKIDKKAGSLSGFPAFGMVARRWGNLKGSRFQGFQETSEGLQVKKRYIVVGWLALVPRRGSTGWTEKSTRTV
jgi:hypothetical protein